MKLFTMLSSPVNRHSLTCINILLSTLLSDIPNLYSFTSVRDQVSHPYKTVGKIMILDT